ncbi:MAG: hypothetical protein JNK64_24285 [Myxococcales bacterium]|nr:hypothetical protein [Myxococcales bacterium]
MRRINDGFVALLFLMAVLWVATLAAPKAWYERLQAAGDAVASIATLATAFALYLTARQFSLSRQQFITVIYAEMKEHFRRVNPENWTPKALRGTLNALDFIATAVRNGLVDEATAFTLSGAAYLDMVDHLRSIEATLSTGGHQRTGPEWVESQENVKWLESRWRARVVSESICVVGQKEDEDAATGSE